MKVPKIKKRQTEEFNFSITNTDKVLNPKTLIPHKFRCVVKLVIKQQNNNVKCFFLIFHHMMLPLGTIQHNGIKLINHWWFTD